MFKVSRKFISLILGFALAITGAVFVKPAQSWAFQADFDPFIFSDSDEESKMVLDFGDLSHVLSATIYRVGQSRSILRKGRPSTYVGSRFATADNISISRYEGNRLLIHDFDKDIETFFEDYQNGLEAFARDVEITSLNKDSQLVFWLNLHNILILNKLIDEYPIKDLKKFRRDDGFFHEKTVTINGVSLSVLDIEKILIANWQSPLVIYGLWQGSIGGPNLPDRAYHQDNVWAILEMNAGEFVNSNRGARPSGKKMLVSDFYEWTLGAFGNSENILLSHIKQFSNPSFHGDISKVNSLKFDYYDWMITDFLGGVAYTGAHSQVGALQSGGTNQKGKVAPGSREPTTGGSSTTGNASLQGKLNRMGQNLGLPPKAVELIREMNKHNDPPPPIPDGDSEGAEGL